jgi:DNA-directed RNA polymerase specialized sigma24 family protein
VTHVTHPIGLGAPCPIPTRSTRSTAPAAQPLAPGRNALAANRRAARPGSVPGPEPDIVALVAALARLPLPTRTTLVLHHLTDLTVAEVARETGVPEGTVKARLARGRRALATMLTADNSEDLHVG